jgi:hypothetical protein
MALRDRVKATSDSAMHEDAVDIVVTLEDGERIELSVAHAIGSLERPLSNEAINAKFVKQSSAIIGETAANDLLAKAWAVETTSEIASISLASAAMA